MFKKLQMRGASEERSEPYMLYGEQVPERGTKQMESLGHISL